MHAKENVSKFLGVYYIYFHTFVLTTYAFKLASYTKKSTLKFLKMTL